MEEAANQLSEFGKIAVFFILGVLFVLIAYGISYLLSKSNPSPWKLSTYECGEEPEGNARIQFNNRFYVIALVFLLFDVEIVFLFPWSAVFAHDAITPSIPVWGWFTFAEMVIFIGVLLIGLVYVWVKGDLAWIKPKQLIPMADTRIPAELYQAINAETFTVRPFRSEPALSEEASQRSPATASPVPAAGKPAATAPAKPAFRPRILKK